MNHPLSIKKQQSSIAPFYQTTSFFCSLLFGAGTKSVLTEEEEGSIPYDQPALLAANHISHFDPPLLSGVIKHQIDWLAMEELFSGKRWNNFFQKLGCIPVSRNDTLSTNKAALRKLLERLKMGRWVGIFPEGGIRSGKSSMLEGAPLKPGLLTMSMMAQVPIVPCVILGTDRLYRLSSWLKRTPVWVILGRPLFPPSREQKGSPDQRGEQGLFAREVAAAFPRLKEVLIKRYSIPAEMLPTEPRMGW